MQSRIMAEVEWINIPLNICPDGHETTTSSICSVCGKEAFPLCPECGQARPDDERVKARMRCRFCAYGG